MSRALILCLGVGMGLLQTSNPAASEPQAAPEPAPLKALWWESKPFCFMQGNVLTGFGCEMLDAVLGEAGLPYETVQVASSALALEKLARGEGDLTASPIIRLSELEANYDFTYGLHDTGAQIVVASSMASPSLWHQLRDTPLLKTLAAALLVVILVAHLTWLAERNKPGSNFRAGYLPGLFDALWWACVTVTTVGYGDTVPRHPLGRSIGLVWMFAGLFLFSLFIAQITTALTVQQLAGNIQTLNDLRGFRVGTVGGNPYVERLRARGVDPILFDTPGELYAAMTAGDIDALVHLNAAAADYVRNEGAGRALLAGSSFDVTDAAFMLREGSPHLEALNRAILLTRESGLQQRIQERWFPNLE